MNALELKIPPPAVAVLIALAMWGLSDVGPGLDLPAAVRIVAALAVALAGGAIAVSGNVAFRRAGTTVNPMKPQRTAALVTTSVYRFTRNPMYFGLLFVLLGWVAFLCSASAIAGPVVFVLYINRFQIEPEERVLASMFGAEYAGYKSRVRRWV